MNPRIKQLNAHIRSEVLAPVTTVVWSPTEGPLAASITFQCARFHQYTEDGTYFGAPESDGSITVSASQLLGRKIPLMLPGGQVIGEQPAELFDAMLRGLFNMLYAETRYVVPTDPEPPVANAPVKP